MEACTKANQDEQAGERADGALCTTCSERPGLLGPANDRTLKALSHSQGDTNLSEEEGRGLEQRQQRPCAVLGGGKRAKIEDEDQILEDDDMQVGERTTPGHLRDRLVVLQARALEAIRSLLVQSAM